MTEQQDIDTYTKIEYAIGLLESDAPISPVVRRNIALLLRRWRKERYGSALTERERAEGRAEMNP